MTWPNFPNRTIWTGIVSLLVALVVPTMACSIPVPTPTPVPSETVSFKVPAGSDYKVNVAMQVGSKMEYRFTGDLDINFELIDPLGAQLGRLSRVEHLNGDVTAAVKGVYTLRFDNSFSLLTSKNIDLTYRVVPQGGR